MIGVAFWHLAALVPDRFWAASSAPLSRPWQVLVSGLLLPEPGISQENPPGAAEAIWAIPGSVAALMASYLYGARRDSAPGIRRDQDIPTPAVSLRCAAGTSEMVVFIHRRAKGQQRPWAT